MAAMGTSVRVVDGVADRVESAVGVCTFFDRVVVVRSSTRVVTFYAAAEAAKGQKCEVSLRTVMTCGLAHPRNCAHDGLMI
jgi:hypothetical protein